MKIRYYWVKFHSITIKSEKFQFSWSKPTTIIFVIKLCLTCYLSLPRSSYIVVSLTYADSWSSCSKMRIGIKMRILEVWNRLNYSSYGYIHFNTNHLNWWNKSQTFILILILPWWFSDLSVRLFVKAGVGKIFSIYEIIWECYEKYLSWGL